MKKILGLNIRINDGIPEDRVYLVSPPIFDDEGKLLFNRVAMIKLQ